MLTTADVNKVTCDFVTKALDYLNCQKYSITCCSTDAQQAFTQYKLATFTECDLTYAQECFLKNIDYEGTYTDCNNTAVVTDCSSQATLHLDYVMTTKTWATSLKNPVDSSAYPHITLVDNTIYQQGYLNAVTIDTSTLAVFATQSVGVSTQYPSTFGFGGSLGFTIGNNSWTASSGSGYIKIIRLYKTDSAGTFINTPIDIDVSPTTSPYLSGAGLTTVTASHLYFGHADWVNSIQNVVKNAVKILSGSAANVGITAAVYLGSSGYLVMSFTTVIKHHPSSYWFGLLQTDPLFTYWDGSANVNITTNGQAWLLPNYPASSSITVPVVFPCATANYTISPKNYTTPLHASSKFYELVLYNGGNALEAPTFTSTSQSCDYLALTATVTSSSTHTTEWKDPDGMVIGTTDTVTVPYRTGTFTCKITLPSGCTFTDTLEFGGR